MHLDSISQAIAQAHGTPLFASWEPPELAEAKAKAEQMLMMKDWNAHPHYVEKIWNDHPLGKTYLEEIQEIIEAIAALDLPLKVYSGTGLGYVYTDKHGSTDHFEHELHKVVWPAEGHEIEFIFLPPDDVAKEDRIPHESKGRVKGRMYTVETPRQGSYFKCKRFWQMMKELFLEHCGYNSWQGRATWSINSEIKAQPSCKTQDWRWQASFQGVDSSGNPIYINKLMLMYLRMGFVANPYGIWGDDRGCAQDEREVLLLSDAATQRTKDWLGDEAWQELTKYDQRNASAWRKLQKQRMKNVDPAELEERKKIVLEAYIETQKTLDQLN